MNNIKVVIDAGHGGSDPGASGNGIVEKDLTLAISLYMYDLLKRKGVDVKLTRTDDETLSPSQRVTKILDAFGNNKDVIVISNHINAGGGDGAEVIYALRNSNKLSNLILDNLEKKGQNIRKSYQRRLPSDPSRDYYFIHRNTGITEPVLIEYGFLDSNKDDVEQLKNDYKKYVEAVVDSILEYKGISDEYIVKKGDTLYSISKKFDVSVDELKNKNNLTSNTLSIGQILKIPNMIGPIENENEIIYTVLPGDTLYKIALNNNITVQDLIDYNNLKNDILSIGQIIRIPVINDIEYVVKSGDSLYSISKRFGFSVQELMNYNNLKSNLLKINQVLKIPKKN